MRGFGQGIATISRRDGAILEIWYPHIGLDDYRPDAQLAPECHRDELRDVRFETAETVIDLGRRCLLGANAGTGISLGDDCAIEAGLYITRGTLVTLPDGRVVKAIELNGRPGILFRRHSVHGNVEAVAWHSSTFTGLNPDLHS